MVKDDSDSYAVFTEQGVVCISNDGRPSHMCHCKATRLRRTSSRRSISLHKVKSKQEVILEAQRNEKKVNLATMVDICHLKKC